MRDLNEPISHHSSSRTKFKQRIAGGAVLLIVLAIFLPFIFNHARNSPNLEQAINTPPSTQENNPAVNPNTQTTPTDQPAQPAGMQTALTIPEESKAPASEKTGLTSAQSESAPISQPESQTVLPPPQETRSAESPPAPDAAPAGQSAVNSTTATGQTSVADKPDSHAVSPKTAQPIAAGYWVLQVGSFNNIENAQQLAAKLRARGFHASIQKGANQMVRVIVGPVATLQQVQKVQEQIQIEFKVSALVRQVHK